MKKVTAFSLVEISMVILIIGILVAAVTQSARIIEKSRLSNARNITVSSGIDNIPNMVFWVESTMENSITSATNGLQPENGDSVSGWKDLNPSDTVYNLSQSTSGSRPTYVTKAINGLPALSFDGSNDTFRTTNLTTKDFSLFAVIQTASAGLGNSGSYPFDGSGVIWADSSGPANDVIPISIAGGKVKFGVGSAGGGYTTITSSASVNNNLPHIISSIRIMNSGAMTLYIDGSLAGSATGSTSLLNYNSYMDIGGNVLDTRYYNGYIAELVIFNRFLKQTERKSVEQYLGKKWGVTVS